MADEKKLDETREGGLYVKGNQVIDANGNPVPGYKVVNGEAVAIATKPKQSPADPNTPPQGNS